ncbi:metal-dependent hydrolase family protein [Edaphobacillus lindanitolerans]|uniref:Pro-Hyp dipeptidase. Metallo peptidase. MEROPS family M38 n=1 Tax=Edaphobacillus lindanitolerans TaxID=550447 RepID=A0A1U7PMY3_9BACI|nr:amidohydrolase family protein [Edaphobacillus lindanitolerans]SIT72828.1 Pro-Hyp dipeptidase. Metallo peptidase. MEROPS family M38 [Edaphobacillus lindanitolerans]
MEYIISNVCLLLGEELEPVSDRAVWVKDGVIRDVIADSEIPGDVLVYDGGNHLLMPGLVDLHIHMMWDGSADPVATLESEGYEQMLIRAVANCRHYLEHGITTVRDVGSVDDIALHVAKSIRRGLVPGPAVLASGKTLTMTGGHDPFWARFVDGPDEALKGVREQIYKGAQVIKVSATGGAYGRDEGEQVGHAELNLSELTVIADEAHRFGLKVASHAIGRDGIRNSLLAGIDTIEHGHFLDDELIGLMKERGAAWIPTLHVYRQLATMDEIPDYAKEKAKEITEIHAAAFKKYFKCGVMVGAGSDAGSPGTSHHAIKDELYAMYHLVPDAKAVLKTATVNAGKILGMNVGQIAKGYQANLLMVAGNPLENLEHLEKVKQVIVDGKIVINHSFAAVSEMETVQ